MLIDLDALYTEIIESNVTPEFRGLVKDKVEEIDERKKKHYESLVEFRSKYEKTVDAIDTVN